MTEQETTTKSYILIENEGEIDPNAFRLIGASTKRGDDSKIGFFGSGLKYAMAVALKNKMDFRVFAGESEVIIGTKATSFRGQNFEVITIDGMETSLTTDMGVDWKPWFVVREVYCNALDEGAVVLTTSNAPSGEEKKTRFFIEITDDLKKLTAHWSSYFSDKRDDAIHTTDDGKIFPTRNPMIAYRRGVRVLDEKIQSIFDYDLKSFEINESRVIPSRWQLENEVEKYLRKIDDVNVINMIFEKGNTELFEVKLDWDNHYVHFTDTWLLAIGKKTLVKAETAGFMEDRIRIAPEQYLLLPTKFVDALKKYFGDQVRVSGEKVDRKYHEINPFEWQVKMLEEVKGFLKEGGVTIDKYPISVVDFPYREILGEADTEHNIIYLSYKAFDEGRKDLACTLVEEWSHLESHAGDGTRQFQNHLIKLFIREIEEKTSKHL